MKINHPYIGKNLIHNPKVWGIHNNPHISILKIVTKLNAYTQIDFLHVASENRYCHNGMVTIVNDIYIRPSDTDIRLNVIEMVGIDFFPKRKLLDKNEICSYSIYFEPLPNETELIDIIEYNGDLTGHNNFTLVSLNKEHREIFTNISKN